MIFIQASVGRPAMYFDAPELHKFVGALAGQGAKNGIFLTTSYFTKNALSYPSKNEIKIVLIDGEQLAN
ncbi:restriction endonuclease [Mucilaginibacter daejeonensis]|nr:restriction endonuclease [Mucilaginibacter daejeonensis]